METPKKLNSDVRIDISTSNSPKSQASASDFPGFQMPPGHEAFKLGSQDQCPFMAKQKSEMQGASACPMGGAAGQAKTKKPKGGCPIMTSEKKKNPPLEPLPFSYK